MNWSAPFEDLTVGQEFATRGRTITEADVVGFAALTGDWHPQHADAEWFRQRQRHTGSAYPYCWMPRRPCSIWK